MTVATVSGTGQTPIKPARSPRQVYTPTGKVWAHEVTAAEVDEFFPQGELARPAIPCARITAKVCRDCAAPLQGSSWHRGGQRCSSKRVIC